jgi:Uma2 family endonuclease
MASSEIGAELLMRFSRGRGGPGAWWILDEPELHLGDDVLVPDLAGWRRERMPVIPDAAYFTLAPDWICEVASPSTNRFDRIRSLEGTDLSTAAIPTECREDACPSLTFDRLLKMPVYLREQVAFVWLVDPIDRYVEAFAYETGRWVLLGRWGSESEARIPPFDAVPLELSAWWLPEDSGSEHT